MLRDCFISTLPEVAELYMCVCVSNEMQQCAVYIFHFTAKLLYMFRVPFTPIIRSTGKCGRIPLVQVICRDSLEGATGNPLKSIHSQATTTLHHGQIKTHKHKIAELI
jgi:hypothetical protein